MILTTYKSWDDPPSSHIAQLHKHGALSNALGLIFLFHREVLNVQQSSSSQNQDFQFLTKVAWQIVPHSIHGTGTFSYIYHKNQPNVGNYTIHRWYGRQTAQCLNINCPKTPSLWSLPRECFQPGGGEVEIRGVGWRGFLLKFLGFVGFLLGKKNIWKARKRQWCFQWCRKKHLSKRRVDFLDSTREASKCLTSTFFEKTSSKVQKVPQKGDKQKINSKNWNNKRKSTSSKSQFFEMLLLLYPIYILC